MNFNIVENATIEWDIEEIIQDYQDVNLSVKEIREKHGISRGSWHRVLNILKEQNIPLRGYRSKGYVKNRKEYDTYTRNNHCYYDKKLKRYKIVRMINKQMHYFGLYPTLEEAERKVCELDANGWDGLL